MAQSDLQWLKQASRIDVTASAIARHTIPEHELKLLHNQKEYRMITLGNRKEVFQNDIDPSYLINLIEKINLTSHEFKVVSRRPHLTMEIPILFNKEDSLESAEIKSIYMSLAFPSIIDYMKKYNLSGTSSIRHLITVSKLESNNPQPAHVDNKVGVNSFLAMLYINDDYQDGDIYFPDNNISYKPKPGDLVIYPGEVKHGVKASIGNPRYTIGYGLANIDSE